MNILIIILLVLTVIEFAVALYQGFDDKSKTRKRYEDVINKSMEVNKLSQEIIDNAVEVNNGCRDMLKLITELDNRMDMLDNEINEVKKGCLNENDDESKIFINNIVEEIKHTL